MPSLDGAHLEAARFADLPGWEDDDHAEAFRAFAASCTRPIRTRPDPELAAALERICDLAPKEKILSREEARAFFEQNFDPWRLLAREERKTAAKKGDAAKKAVKAKPADEKVVEKTDAKDAKLAVEPVTSVESPAASTTAGTPPPAPVAPAPTNTPFGFVTAYYEPELPGSLAQDARYPVPLYGRPPELVTWLETAAPAGAPANLVGARREGDALVPYFTRAEIQAGALNGRSLEVAWVADPVDAFFVHIQGSVRLRLDNGDRVRIGYAARNGHPYTALGKILAQRSGIEAKKITMDTVRGWLAKEPERVHALLNENPSFVFFRLTETTDPRLGPPGAAGVQLTPGRSVAVDWRVHPYGVPVFVATRTPEAPGGKQAPFHRLMIAQDTGTAIVGAARLDLFIGSGDEAGRVAGQVRDAEPRVWVLRPKSGGS